MFVSLVSLVVLVISSCTNEAPPVQPGNERQPCRSGGCDPDLVCLSDRCVRPPGADCTLVAEALTSMELGNYAPLETRRPKVEVYRAKCEAQHLTKEEGACVIAATTMEQLRACPKPVMFAPYKPTTKGQTIQGLPAECSRYLLTLERYAGCSGLPPEARASLGSTVAEMRKSWSMFSEKTPMPPEVTAACKQGEDAIATAMVSFKCN